MSTRFGQAIEREVVALLLALMMIALTVLPRNAAATVALTALIVAPVIVILARRRSVVPVSRASLVTVGAAGSVALLALGAAALAATPSVSLWGARGQRTGAVLWVGLVVLLAVLVWRGRRGDILRSSRAVAVLSAALAASALLEYTGLLRSIRLADSASGLLENSISLAQVLTIGLGCTLLWALRAQHSTQRAIAWVCAALTALGIVVSETRAALVAVAAVVVLGVLSRLLASRFGLSSKWLATLMIAFAAIALGATIALGAVGQSSDIGAKADSVLSGRVAIWEAASSKAMRTLAFGSGPEQFTAWAQWTSQPLADIEKASTDDPHSILLYWLLAVGVPGLLGLLAVSWLATERVVAALAATGWQPAMMAVAFGLGAWAVQLLLAWTSPLAAMCAVIVFAAVLGALDSADTSQPGASAGAAIPDSLVTAIVLALSALALLGFLRIGSAEVEWARSLSRGTLPAWEQMAQLASRTGDPAYAIDAAAGVHDAVLVSRDRESHVAAREQLEPLLAESKAWSVGAAFAVNQLRFDSLALGADVSWADVLATLDSARAADPTSGLWPYLGAVEATLLKHDADAREFARESLGYWLPGAVRAWSEGITAGD